MCQYIANRLLIALSALFLSHMTIAQPLDPFEAKQAPVSDFVNWVSGHTGTNIILGSGVDGTISATINDLDSSQIMDLFDQVMHSNGYKVIKNNGVYQVTTDSQEIIPLEPLHTKLYRLQFIRNTKCKDVINSLLKSSYQTDSDKKLSQSSISRHSVDILDGSNSLLVSATDNQIRTLDSLLPQIDTDVRQILIEAVILETDLGNSHSVGVNLTNAISGSGLGLISNTLGNVLSTESLTEGGHAVFSKDSDIRALISAIVRDNHSKILSTPNIVVLDREQGHISVGQNVPFLISREVTDGGNTVQQIERKDVGVTLSVKPHVLESGQIILQINQESSSVTNSSQAADIITNKRSISTVAKVSDGETIALGGLVSDETRTVHSGVPLLRSIPWLGRLFRYDREESVQRELTVMIKTIIL
jgi:general secretion pathway protein D